ncbi:uncharacterized protein SCHCODRAFT_02641702 [Schizophyllum commune H4-8]|uniref:uncharacterized protein n=1 Tax=Schizophyllum commune (strain H4-8 / FGSC 9210) TaxID=578458 RepID=UPI00215E0D47|nr:uncharacterized protein SCHCODRAFT_02641702 [Schizophyllum commune H4-8]KAI5886418.1 hypothetical protein SCHCODRAFT_02641702 [Schizophyllum commune H4-8]
MPPPQITVLYFAAASTATGLTSETIVLPSPSPSAELASGAPSKEQLSDIAPTTPSTSATHKTQPHPAAEASHVPLASPCTPHAFPLTSLPSLLASRHPGTNLAGILRDSQWSVDAEMVDDPERVVLTGGEEVAVICPVSGG